jgi:hypothetical protein
MNISAVTHLQHMGKRGGEDPAEAPDERKRRGRARPTLLSMHEKWDSRRRGNDGYALRTWYAFLI